MAVYVSRPVSFLPPFEVSREEILADMVARHPDHPRLSVVRRVVGQMPSRRWYSQPWGVVLSERSLEERNRTAFADVLAMGGAAARGALVAAGLQAADVDCVVTTHATGDAVPGLDVHLVHELGLKATVSRRPMTQIGCGGGAHGLVIAADFVRARPGSVVLLVAAESLSSIYHHADISIEAMIYKALWGDSGVAVLVSDRPMGAGLRIEETWEYLVPGSAGRYRKRLDSAGVHFDSDKTATNSVDDMMPELVKWLADSPGAALATGSAGPARLAGSGPWPLDFVVAHTGGPAILRDLAKGLDLDAAVLRHAWESLDEDGNLGGAAALRVLERTYVTPPAAGDRGLMLGFGPGFSVSACKTTWQDGPDPSTA